MSGRPPMGARARLIPRTFRLMESENLQLEQQAADRGFQNPSAYLRWLIKQDAAASIQAREKSKRKRPWDD